MFHQPGEHRGQLHRRGDGRLPSNSAITAICQPTTCNPAPINQMGTLGTGVPAISNFVQIASPGKNSTYIWISSPGSPYFVPIDLSTGTIGNQIKLPYSPNSMVLDPTGTTLYFGSYHELMTYTAATNSLVVGGDLHPRHRPGGLAHQLFRGGE